MASNKPVTYLDALAMFARRGTNHTDTTIEFRPNTHLRLVQEDPEDTFKFDVLLYGAQVARMYSDGNVRVYTGGRETFTTRNRINDVLSPLGWKVRIVEGQWKIVPLLASDHTTWIDFREGMLIEPRPGSPVYMSKN